MRDFVSGWFGLLLGGLFFLFVGALVVFGLTKLVKFNENTYGNVLLYWIVSLGLIWVLESIYQPPYVLEAPENILGELPIWSVNSIAFFFLEMLSMVLLTRYWFKEAWFGTAAVAAMAFLCQKVLPFGSVLVAFYVFGVAR